MNSNFFKKYKFNPFFNKEGFIPNNYILSKEKNIFFNQFNDRFFYLLKDEANSIEEEVTLSSKLNLR